MSYLDTYIVENEPYIHRPEVYSKKSLVSTSLIFRCDGERPRMRHSNPFLRCCGLTKFLRSAVPNCTECCESMARMRNTYCAPSEIVQETDISHLRTRQHSAEWAW